MDNVSVRAIVHLFAAVAALLSPALAEDASPALRTNSGRVSGLVITDLDGDRQNDLASAGASHRDGGGWVQEIRLNFSSVEPDILTVRTRLAGERLIARDLDGDRDLVLEAFNREPVAVLLNDGDGHFHEGDLADFQFQLSHRSPRSCASIE